MAATLIKIDLLLQLDLALRGFNFHCPIWFQHFNAQKFKVKIESGRKENELKKGATSKMKISLRKIHHNGGTTIDNAINEFKLLMKDIHKHLPETEIYYFSMINRDGTMPGKSSSVTSQLVKDYNSAVQEVINQDNLVKYCDIYSHFTNSDGSAKSDLLKDGCHPKDNEYKYFVETAIETGAPIRYIGE